MSVKGSFNDFYPSRWIKGDDVGKGLTVTVKDVNYEAVGEDQEMKLTLSFHEIGKDLCLNKTNATALQDMYGIDPNAAIGKRIDLYTAPITYKGKTTMAVRISPEPPEAPKPQPKRTEKQNLGELGFGDETPEMPEFDGLPF